jgi:hypothetical protein
MSTTLKSHDTKVRHEVAAKDATCLNATIEVCRAIPLKKSELSLLLSFLIVFFSLTFAVLEFFGPRPDQVGEEIAGLFILCAGSALFYCLMRNRWLYRTCCILFAVTLIFSYVDLQKDTTFLLIGHDTLIVYKSHNASKVNSIDGYILHPCRGSFKSALCSRISDVRLYAVPSRPAQISLIQKFSPERIDAKVRKMIE